MMSTYVVIYLLQYSLGSWLQEDKHEYLKTNSIKKSVWLPKIIDGTSVSLGIVIAVIAAIVVFILTENMNNPMAFTDRWTILMAVILLIQVVVAMIAKKSKDENEDDEMATMNA